MNNKDLRGPDGNSSTSWLAVIGAVSAALVALIAAIAQILQSSERPALSQSTFVVATAAVFGAILTVLTTLLTRILARRRRERSRLRAEKTASFLRQWDALEGTLRTHIRASDGGEVTLRILLSRSSELSSNPKTADLLYSLLAMRNSLVHKGAQLSVEELEVAIGALASIRAEMDEAFGSGSKRDGSSTRSAPDANFQVFRNERGTYSWRLMTNGRSVVTSGDYATVAQAMKDIGRLRSASAQAPVWSTTD